MAHNPRRNANAITFCILLIYKQKIALQIINNFLHTIYRIRDFAIVPNFWCWCFSTLLTSRGIVFPSVQAFIAVRNLISNLLFMTITHQPNGAWWNPNSPNNSSSVSYALVTQLCAAAYKYNLLNRIFCVIWIDSIACVAVVLFR